MDYPNARAVRHADLPAELLQPLSGIDQTPIAEIIGNPDPMTIPGPDDVTPGVHAILAAKSADWPDDPDAPDYAHLQNHEAASSFDLDATIIERLFRINRFRPDRGSGVVAIALRGAVLDSGHEAVDQTKVRLRNVRPDHGSLRCVIGFYWPDSGKISLFAGSTVPCPRYLAAQVGKSDTVANQLPSGCYSYFVWRHRQLPFALRLSYGNRSVDELERGGLAAVLRSRDDLSLTVADPFIPGHPLDNIHCTYLLDYKSEYGASFSSAGCLTVRGTPAPSQQWAKFVGVLKGLGERRRVDLVMLTGKDAALAAANLGPQSILRTGSRGAEVEALQQRLGVTETGYFGAGTMDALTTHQRGLNAAQGLGAIADGIYSAGTDQVTGWHVLNTGGEDDDV